MAQHIIISILRSHGIDYEIVNYRVIAHEVFTQRINAAVVTGVDLVDVTDYTMTQIKNWLGY